MNKFLVVAFALAVSLATASAADARGGCGIGWHRGPYGGCRRNEGPVIVGPVVGPVVAAPMRACPWGYHLGPYGRACHPN